MPGSEPDHWRTLFMSFNTQARDNAALITSDAQALRVASELALIFKAESARRDRERRLPHAELDVYSQSGLWGISVPKAFGGAGG
ncbi:Acyl-CoA dehydrogenase protein, partial [Pseudomonas coronafaciens pv. garcae]